MIHIGAIVRLQVQLDRLKKGTPPQQYYDPGALCVVPAVRLTSAGVVGLRDGQELVDVHHADHPYAQGRGSSGISINFTAHYERMQARYGGDLAAGCAGENILIAAGRIMKLSDMVDGLVIQNDRGTQVHLTQIQVAHPCRSFSAYALELGGLPAGEMLKETLQFLDAGTRGFYAEWAGSPVVVQVGDPVFLYSG